MQLFTLYKSPGTKCKSDVFQLDKKVEDIE